MLAAKNIIYIKYTKYLHVIYSNIIPYLALWQRQYFTQRRHFNLSAK